MWGINWLAISNIIYLPTVLVISALVYWLFKKRTVAVAKLVHSKNRFLLLNCSNTKELVKLLSVFVALVMLGIVLLNPSTKKGEHFVEQRCRDVFVVLDVSKSMLAEDVAPNRLEFTKDKIRTFLRMLPKDRVGLVLFAAGAFVQCPLTRDHSAFNMFLGQIDQDTVSGGSTSIASAVQVCIDQCKKENNQSKIIVIFTDGEDFSSDLLNVKRQAAEMDIKIFAVGIGTKEGSTIPQLDKYGRLVGNQKDRKGKEVVTRLNEGIIENLAQEFNGVYVPMTNNNSDLKKIVKAVKKFDAHKVEDKQLSAYKSIYPFLALVALICLIFAWLI
jgi:Ca-activated chloride channel homolog